MCPSESARKNPRSSLPCGSTHTVALVTVISTSPRAALISSPNLEQTPPRRPRRLFSARVWRKFFTVALVPAVFSSSATMADLSAGVRVGASRMVASLASWETRLPSLLRAVAVGSTEEDLTAAVYCLFRQNDALASERSARLAHGPGASIARLPSPSRYWSPSDSRSIRRGDVPGQWHRCHRRRRGRREA